jgi:hypothetical protein
MDPETLQKIKYCEKAKHARRIDSRSPTEQMILIRKIVTDANRLERLSAKLTQCVLLYLDDC